MSREQYSITLDGALVDEFWYRDAYYCYYQDAGVTYGLRTYAGGRALVMYTDFGSHNLMFSEDGRSVHLASYTFGEVARELVGGLPSTVLEYAERQAQLQEYVASGEWGKVWNEL